MVRAKIIGIGSYVPERVLTNHDLERMVDTSDEWIVSRTGISERRIAAQDEDTSDMCVKAAAGAFAMAGVTPQALDLIIAASVTPDFRVPSMACIIQKKIGATNAVAMDIASACTGFISGLAIAQAFIRSGIYRHVLVFGAEKLTSITNYADRNTCVLFGDGAGAAIVAPSDDDSGILSTYLKSDGNFDHLLYIPAGGTHEPIRCNGNFDHARLCLRMNGNEVFRHAVRFMGDAAMHVVHDAGLQPHQVDLLVPHQANIRIIRATAARVGIPMEKVYLNIAKYGNTSAASVPIAMTEALSEGRIKKGSHVVGVAFGGGLIWGAVAIRW
jgi:3-oxoacyl-[acyl-carrier-protein] synthase-3